MFSIRNLLILGFVFLTNGITFMMVGLTTQLDIFWTLVPSFMTLGVVFLAISRTSRRARNPASPLPEE